jgi:hypothetical protein
MSPATSSDVTGDFRGGTFIFAGGGWGGGEVGARSGGSAALDVLALPEAVLGWLFFRAGFETLSRINNRRTAPARRIRSGALRLMDIFVSSIAGIRPANPSSVESFLRLSF